jgi:hypothetical protein
MPYGFSFDISHAPQEFYKILAKGAYDKNFHTRVGGVVRQIAEKLKIEELTSLNMSEVKMLVQDLMDINFRNMSERESFQRTKKRALFLPHCARKYMDNRCQARFDEDVPSYRCAKCSPDCLVNESTALAERKGYDVYVLPGGTCLPEIIKRNSYEGVVGVACSQELKQVEKLFKHRGMPTQTVFLIKNGCSNTKFNMQSLEEVL